MKYLRARRDALGGYLPQRRRKSARSRSRRSSTFERLLEEHRRARDLDHDGLRADARHAGARQEHRQARRAHRARRIAHLRHGRHVPPARHLLVARPALQAAGRRPADVLPRVEGRAGAAGGHQRRRRDVDVDRRGHLVQHEQRADDPVLHLLLDVRLAARGRSGLAGRRHPLPAASCSAAPPGAPRSTAKACSTRTATATSWPATIPNCVSYDPTFALRGGDDRPRRHAAHVRGPGRRLLLPHADERELPAPRHARRQRGGNTQGPVPASGRRQVIGQEGPCACS